MDKLSELIGQPLNFRLWVDGLVELHYGASTLKQQKNFNEKVFKGGIQKIILLAVLLFACSFTFWTAKNIPPDKIDEIFSKTFVATVVSGFAIYLLCNLLVYLLTSKIETARYCTNIIILHVAVSLAIMLLGNVSGVSSKIDVSVYKWLNNAKIAAGIWCFICSSPVILASLINTLKKEKQAIGNSLAIAGRLVAYSTTTVLLLFMYLSQVLIAA